MTVYFIQESATGGVKIGYTSKDPNERLKELQTGSVSELVLIGHFPGTEENEQELHRQFSHLRLRGEWFRMSDELSEFIQRFVQQNERPPYNQNVVQKLGGRVLDKIIKEVIDKIERELK